MGIIKMLMPWYKGDIAYEQLTILCYKISTLATLLSILLIHAVYKLPVYSFQF